MLSQCNMASQSDPIAWISHTEVSMLKFRSQQPVEVPPTVNTIVGVNSTFRGTVMVSGTLRIDGEFEGDILNCERLEVGEHGVLRAGRVGEVVAGV